MEHAQEAAIWRAVGNVEAVANELDERMVAVESLPKRRRAWVDAAHIVLLAFVCWHVVGFLVAARERFEGQALLVAKRCGQDAAWRGEAWR